MLLICAFVATFVLQAVASIYLNAFRVLRDTQVLKYAQVASAAIRLILVMALVATFAPTAPLLSVANLVAALSLLAALLWASSRGSRAGNFSSKLAATGEQREHRAALGSHMRHVLPATLALIGGEQFFLLIASLRGTPEVVADISAFARLGLAFYVVNAIAVDVVAPSIAHLPASRPAVRHAFRSATTQYGLFSAAIVLATLALAGPILHLLGNQYLGLEGPLVVVMTGYALINLGHVLNSLVQARGWVHGWKLYVPLLAIWAFAGWFVDLTDTLAASIYFGFQAVPYLALQGLRLWRGLRELPLQAPVETA
jgi:hypothetical protein